MLLSKMIIMELRHFILHCILQKTFNICAYQAVSLISCFILQIHPHVIISCSPVPDSPSTPVPRQPHQPCSLWFFSHLISSLPALLFPPHLCSSASLHLHLVPSLVQFVFKSSHQLGRSRDICCVCFILSVLTFGSPFFSSRCDKATYMTVFYF